MSMISYQTENYNKESLFDLYKKLLYPRLIEEKMLILLRQGRISKWFSGIGQEAISVGVTAAMNPDEKIFPMHRNLGVFTTREVPLFNLFTQWQGKASGFTKGRDRSFHFGTKDYNIVGMISHLGPQLSLASGVALAYKLKQEQKVSVAFTGEGGTSQGEFHEALNLASVWQLPVIFVIENNGYGLSTPTSEQYRCQNLADRAQGYGMESIIIDGNNIIEVYETFKKITEDLRNNPRPYLVECRTFRMRGHEEASGTKYVPQELMDEWAAKDPIQNFENHLLELKVINRDDIDEIKKGIKAEINAAINKAYEEEDITSNLESEINDVFANHQHQSAAPNDRTHEVRFIDAITDGLDLAMSKHDDLVLMGQDIADYGGVFKVTQGFKEKYGGDRVRNTPLCESAVIGAAMGLSLQGMKSMMEMQFSDFVTCGFNQIVNNLAKSHYRWGHAADVVIRMPTGAGVGAGPYHSQSTEAWFTHTAGLKILYPSNPYDAKGLLISAFEDPNPVMYFEHKALYRNIQGIVPEGYYNVQIGQAKVLKSGSDLSIITYGMGVYWAHDYVKEHGIDAEIIDLRTLSPIDYATIEESVKKTNRALILHEDVMFGGIGGDISGYISEHLFEYLDAPVKRVAALDMPIPFAKNLEEIYLPKERMKKAISQLLEY